MRLNVWISALYKGNQTAFKSLPYTTQSPSTGERIVINSIADVWAEIERRIIETQGSRFSLGCNVWSVLPLFANPELLIDEDAQDMMREYNVVKNYNVPLAESLEKTDARKVRLFEVIEEEITAIQEYNHAN